MTNSAGRILVVEDDESLRMTLEQLLSGEGFEVRSANDGLVALDLCREIKPDLVLLDFELPSINGQQVCRQLREFSDAYVVMLTGRSSELDKVTTLSLGADDYITKPFSHPELLARIHNMLRRQNKISSKEIQKRLFGSLCIDINSREVTTQQSALDLTRIEFDILNALTENPGTVVTRKYLLKEVWDTEWNAEDHLVDVHVHNLRRKLKSAGVPSSAIITIRGVGFRFNGTDLP